MSNPGPLSVARRADVDDLDRDLEAGVPRPTAETNRDHHPVSCIDEFLRLDPEPVEGLGLEADESQHPLLALHLARVGEDAGRLLIARQIGRLLFTATIVGTPDRHRGEGASREDRRSHDPMPEGQSPSTSGGRWAVGAALAFAG